MSKTDNLLKKVLTDEDIRKEYKIEKPEQYTNIALAMRSKNGYVVAIATALNYVDMIVEELRSEKRIKNDSSPVKLQDKELKTIYKKIITVLEKAQ